MVSRECELAMSFPGRSETSHAGVLGGFPEGLEKLRAAAACGDYLAPRLPKKLSFGRVCPYHKGKKVGSSLRLSPYMGETKQSRLEIRNPSA